MITTITELFCYDFFRNAILAAILSSIVCGIIGTYIVAKRLVFISGGITHASFGGIGMAYFLGFDPIIGAAIFALLSAFGIEFLSGRIEIRQDSAIGVFWSLGMAVGIIFIYLSAGYSPNLMSYLFGSILTVNSLDLWLMLLLAAVVGLFFLLFFRTILYVAYDEEYARTKRLPVTFLNYLMLSLVALTIVLNIRTVGVILVISFLTLPQITANTFTQNFRKLIFYSILVAILGSVGGLIVSYYLNLPSGPVIICCFVGIFAVARFLQWFMVHLRVNKINKVNIF
ncbi:MAG: metal ABC transporter permease [Bacteroidota bacterium]